MKKGFGWFFLIFGGLSAFRGFLMVGQGIGTGGGVILLGIATIVLGIWMISTSKPKE